MEKRGEGKTAGYEMEELLPVVAWLAGKYTSGESSSVTYEKARQLMSAVIYCLEAGQEPEEIFSFGCDSGEKPQMGTVSGCSLEANEMMVLTSRKEKRVSARLAYEQGYQAIVEKTRRTAQRYNEMVVNFRSYGNENYEDTVKKALSGFFLYYDARFAPQETIITMDYPTLLPVTGETGIHAMARDVEQICLEQKFLGKLPEAYVRRVLCTYCSDYKKQFFNICNIVLRDMLLCIIAGKTPGEPLEEKQKEQLRRKAADDRSGLENALEKAVRRIILEKYGEEEQLYQYLKADVRNFAAELQWM